MGLRLKRGHMIDFLFPVALLFVFALSALSLVLLAAGVYRSTTENSSLQYTARSSLAYLSEKIHQCDENGGVFLGTLDGYDALILEQTYEDEVYHTYIYACDEELKELFVKDGAEVSARSGRTILEVQNFTVEQISEHLLRFTCTDAEDRTSAAIIGVRSRP